MRSAIVLICFKSAGVNSPRVIRNAFDPDRISDRKVIFSRKFFQKVRFKAPSLREFEHHCSFELAVIFNGGGQHCYVAKPNLFENILRCEVFE